MVEPFLGEIRMISFDKVPDGGWLPCDGQSLSIASNNALFLLLGTKYGGDGQTTFNLPNLNGNSQKTQIIPVGSFDTPLGQIGAISIPPKITSSVIPAQNISFTLVNTTII